MGKKVLVLLGSPHAGGSSEKLAKAFERGAAANGCDVREVRLAPLCLNGCLGCHKCWLSGNPCIQRDDMDEIYPLLEKADALVFAVPLFFYSWPAQLKPVIDRMFAFLGKSSPVSLKGKQSVLLAVCGDAEEGAFAGLRTSYRILADYMKWVNAGEVCAFGLHTPADTDAVGGKWLAEAEELGKKL